MKKELMFRCLIGAAVGLALTTVLAVLISLLIRDGQFYATVPMLEETWGSEINAVLMQTVCSLVYGAAWGGASIIWKKEEWSLLKMTIVHLVVCSLATFPMAYFMYWMDHSIWGVLTYFGIFWMIYAAIWLWQYLIMKKQVRQFNDRMSLEGVNRK